MLVSWKWLSNYVDLSMTVEELEDRLSFSGLNHEGTEKVGDDFVIDLEVTSNRGDCLGHLGVAREIGVLYDQEVRFPNPTISGGNTPAQSLLSVQNDDEEACSRYTARVIRGCQVADSPDWIADALRSVGIAVVNNIVDVTNYVMLECGQPLHAFDATKIQDNQIRVRPARDGETLEAIDHRTYKLDPSMCVIADGSDAVAVAGVMGGAASEVTSDTTDLIVEAAVFTPLSVRRTARALKLHSPSSFRFERRVDPVGVEWASRRACQLILETAGGEVCDGILDTNPEIAERAPVRLRPEQLTRILGIQVAPEEIRRILITLGCEHAGKDSYTPPTWRHDLTREADLIEEVARIHGYDKIPEDSPIPVAPSQSRTFDTAVGRVRDLLVAAGLSEAMTPSVVTERLDQTISPWTERASLSTQTAMLEGSKRLRRSLIPSLLQSRAGNWAAASIHADLFEIAHVYLPGQTSEALPSETYALGMVRGGDFFELKGILEQLIQRLGVQGRLIVTPVDREGMQSGTAVQLAVRDDQANHETMIGYLGSISDAPLKSWKMPGPIHVAELSLPAVFGVAHLVPQQQSISSFPSIERDLNFVLDESVRWGELESAVRSAVAHSLADVRYRETYRDSEKDGQDKKRVLLTVELQSQTETLSGDQADELIGSVIKTCGKQLGAKLLG